MYTKLKDRKPVTGFTVLNEKRTRQLSVPIDMPSPTGIIIDYQRGFLMDQDGNLYVTDRYDRVIMLGDHIVAVEK